MGRFIWIVAVVPLIILALRLTVMDPDAQAISCIDAERAFEIQDFPATLPERVALIVGNERVKYWSHSPADLGGDTVLMRTIPGLTPEHLSECFPRLVGHYQPNTIILALDTEQSLQTPRGRLMDSLQGIMDQRSIYGLRFELVVMAPIQSPKLTAMDIQSLSGLEMEIRNWSQQTLGTRLVSLNNLFRDDQGNVSPTYFWPDGTTLTDAGYAKLTDLLVAQSNERKKEFTGIVSK